MTGRCRARLSEHPYPVRLDYLGKKYMGYATGTSERENLEVWVPEDNSCIEVLSSSHVEFLKKR